MDKKIGPYVLDDCLDVVNNVIGSGLSDALNNPPLRRLRRMNAGIIMYDIQV